MLSKKNSTKSDKLKLPDEKTRWCALGKFHISVKISTLEKSILALKLPHPRLVHEQASIAF